MSFGISCAPCCAPFVLGNPIGEYPAAAIPGSMSEMAIFQQLQPITLTTRLLNFMRRLAAQVELVPIPNRYSVKPTQAKSGLE